MLSVFKFSLLSSFLIFGPFAQATPSMSVFGGARVQSGSAAGADTSGNKTSFQIGVKNSVEFDSNISLIFGAGLTQRLIGTRVQYPLPGSSADVMGTVRLYSIDAPLLITYALVPSFGIFAGPVVAINLSSKCESDNANFICTADGMKAVTLPLTFGFTMEFSDRIGAEVFYESTLTGSGFFSEFAKDVNNYRAVGANLKVNF